MRMWRRRDGVAADGQDDGQPITAPAGWEPVFDERPLPERALVAAVIAAQQLLDFTVMRPGPGQLEYAARSLRLTRTGAAAGLSALLPGGHQADQEALELHALHQYLLLAMGSRQPELIELAGVLATLAARVSKRTAEYRPMPAVAQLLLAEHQAENGRLADAAAAVDRAIRQLGSLTRSYTAAPAVLEAARTARRHVRAAVPR